MANILKPVSFQELELGWIYNKIYNGDDNVFVRVNGKQTFIVSGLNPIEIRELYSSRGCPMFEHIMANPVTLISPEIAFAEHDIYKAPCEDDWFKKSMILTLTEAFELNLVTKKTVQLRSQPSELVVWGASGKRIMTCKVEDGLIPDWNPYLQMVFVIWDSFAIMVKELTDNGISHPKYDKWI